MTLSVAGVLAIYLFSTCPGRAVRGDEVSGSAFNVAVDGWFREEDLRLPQPNSKSHQRDTDAPHPAA